MEKQYGVMNTQGEPDWSAIPVGRVKCPCWGTTYTPETTFQCAYAPGKALYIRMECRESEPLARCREQDGRVWFDSCMEAFLGPAREGSYMNLECNSIGTLLCSAGSEWYVRQNLAESGLPRPAARCRVEKDWWELRLEVAAETLRGLWGMELAPGGTLYANFYKCGDETEQPHFLSWSPVDLPEPNFHAPEFFGVLKLL